MPRPNNIDNSWSSGFRYRQIPTLIFRMDMGGVVIVGEIVVQIFIERDFKGVIQLLLLRQRGL
ncbi:MAG: hypothetical protein ABI167_00040, partial [Nitrosospira sp.]